MSPATRVTTLSTPWALQRSRRSRRRADDASSALAVDASFTVIDSLGVDDSLVVTGSLAVTDRPAEVSDAADPGAQHCLACAHGAGTILAGFPRPAQAQG